MMLFTLFRLLLYQYLIPPRLPGVIANRFYRAVSSPILWLIGFFNYPAYVSPVPLFPLTRTPRILERPL